MADKWIEGQMWSRSQAVCSGREAAHLSALPEAARRLATDFMIAGIGSPLAAPFFAQGPRRMLLSGLPLGLPRQRLRADIGSVLINGREQFEKEKLK